MANVLIPFPGASSQTVQNMVARPAEQVLSQIQDIEHNYSVARPGVAVLTVQFKVGVPRTEALVRLYDVLNANQDWLPRDLGSLPPVVKPKGIDDVPVLGVTLWSPEAASALELERVARTLEMELKQVKGAREVQTIGGPGRVVQVQLDPTRLRERGIDLLSLKSILAAANFGMPSGAVVQADSGQMLSVETGEFLTSAEDVAGLVVGVHNGKPVYLREVARVEAGAAQPQRYVWFTPGAADAQAAGVQAGQVYPAVTLTVTKKPGENAVDVASAARARLDVLRNTVIPADIRTTVTRDYGETAAEKANKLIQKLAFATGSVILLVGLALGRREAVIVGLAVILTLTATLFASWAWGFPLNRVSLFALIFSIGILVDDAIVVVENIHRHRALGGKSLREAIPLAVDEVGAPTILATFTVIAALLPMAFVSGLMGPYMRPIPINASVGMLISLLIALVVTPWLSLKLLAHGAHAHDEKPSKLQAVAESVMGRFIRGEVAAKKRRLLWLSIFALLALSAGLAVVKLVVLKMLPNDNKSEIQLVVDMPEGSTLEQTDALLGELAVQVDKLPEVLNYQAYAGTSAPVTFNGLVRQYFLRQGPLDGDLQVNLVDKNERSRKSHDIALALRPTLQATAAKYGASLKVVEVPPGPPVMAPLVAEIYGPDYGRSRAIATQLQQRMRATEGVVDIDSTVETAGAVREQLLIDHVRAARLGVSREAVTQTLLAAVDGADISYLQDGRSRYPKAIRLRLPASAQADMARILQLGVKSTSGRVIALSELVQLRTLPWDGAIHHKDLLPVVYVTADEAGEFDSPLYGMFDVVGQLADLPDGPDRLRQYFISQPESEAAYAMKWDGEWQITYETFRDMGLAYAAGLLLIYLLIVAQFKNYLVPLIIMAPIPLTVIGVMPGHALLGAQFTATSMIGMIALAGIIVRNSILLVDFIELQVAQGRDFAEAVVDSARVRAQPIALTALAAMLGALFILDAPIFNGLALALIFGILVSTLLTLFVIPVLYYAAFRQEHS